MTMDVHDRAAPRYRASGLVRPEVWCERRADGSIVLGTREVPSVAPERGLSGHVARWARERGAQTAFAARGADGAWCHLDWAQLQQQMWRVGLGLLDLGLGAGRPLLVLSANSLEQVVLLLAADFVGVPVAPVSPGYSLQSSSYARLRSVAALVQPSAVFVQSVAPFAGALDALGIAAGAVITADAAPGHAGLAAWLQATPSEADLQRLAAAHARIDPERDLARIYFTSGSTGAPKGVPVRYASLAWLAGFTRYVNAPVLEEAPVLLDWLPWSHVYGGLANMCRVLALGGSCYIDDGRPLPGQFERTVRNLREVSPSFFTTVPAAWAMLVDALEQDPVLVRSFFHRLRFVGYGGASLPRDRWERFQAVARRSTGEQIVFISGLASTETCATGLMFNRPIDDLGNIGVPSPGVQARLVPLEGGDGRYEIRLRGAGIFKGYLGDPERTRQAFDEEGFYRIGDAARLVDPLDPTRGLRYAGRCVEDFKLLSGTWVRAGEVRLALLQCCAPLLQDAVICGHDRDCVSALAWLDLAACRRLD